MENGLTRGKEVWKEHLSRGMMVLLIALMLSAFCISPVYGYECQDAYNKELYDTFVVFKDEDGHPFPSEAIRYKAQYGHDLLLKDLKKFQNKMTPEEYKENLTAVDEWYSNMMYVAKKLQHVEETMPEIYGELILDDNNQVVNLDKIIAEHTPEGMEFAPANATGFISAAKVPIALEGQAQNIKNRLLSFSIPSFKDIADVVGSLKGLIATALDDEPVKKKDDGSITVGELGAQTGIVLDFRPTYGYGTDGLVHPIKYNDPYMWYQSEINEMSVCKQAIKDQKYTFAWVKGLLIGGIVINAILCVADVSLLIFMKLKWFSLPGPTTLEIVSLILGAVGFLVAVSGLISDLLFRSLQLDDMVRDKIERIVDMIKEHGFTVPSMSFIDDDDDINDDIKKLIVDNYHNPPGY
ncbi:MAG: hypothetical protein O0V67_08215 [Methanocorpusculum sp.]|nr:hypothetical protein [Methanocorpusculum sp.]